MVSIRALARRATSFRVISCFLTVVSIRALARRATPARCGPNMTCLLFQFVPSRGGQLRKVVPYAYRNAVSIRALARRATRSTLSIAKQPEVSIRALARRATAEEYMQKHGGDLKFQFVPSRGGQP